MESLGSEMPRWLPQGHMATGCQTFVVPNLVGPLSSPPRMAGWGMEELKHILSHGSLSPSWWTVGAPEQAPAPPLRSSADPRERAGQRELEISSPWKITKPTHL